MLLRSRLSNCLLSALVFLLLIFAFSCAQKDRYIGKYVAHGEESAKNSETYIELKEKSLGVWRMLGDEVSFRWDLKDDEIWLRTKAGGIIIAKIKDDTLEVKLPGAKVMSFEKAK
jgi:hypothetical protein